ncbi:MAG: DUF4397 domain-containing protein, partial [Cytophagaceae bacterium]|nr:DUF4397 domain-containing protein [Gemmatimonadaceae bacterium]
MPYTSMLKLPTRSLGLALAFAIGATACGTKDAEGPLAPAGAQGRVRFVNVITDPARATVNAILENVPFGVNLGYTATTPFSLAAPNNAPYAAVLAGSRTLVLKRTADTNTVIATIPFTVEASKDRTLYAVGGTAGSAVASFITDDDNSTPTATQSRIRFVNLSPTAGAVDVFFTAAGADLAAATPTFTNVANRAASAYGSLPNGTYTLRT